MARLQRDLDIPAILKAASEAGVSWLEYGGLKVRFGASWPKWQGQAKPEVKVERFGPPGDETEFKELGDHDEANLRELQTAEMMLLDPESFEKLQLGEEV